MSALSVALDRRTARAVLDGHPWIYPDVLKGAPRVPRPGEEVELLDALGTPIGRALADGGDKPGAPALRVLTLDPRDPPLRKLLFRRVGRARALRERLLPPDTDAFRLLNGEGDELPGLVVDRFADVLVVRPDSAAWEPHAALVAEALRSEGGGATTGLLRSKDGDTRLLWGPEPPEAVVVREEGRRYRVRPGFGQKTGFFLDQRDNRSAVQRLVRPSDRALDLFCFTGGFSTSLAVGGAAHITSVDLAASLLDDVRANLALNDVPLDRHEGVAADLFAWLPAQARRKDVPRWDVVVCDPPALAHRKADVAEARAAYRRLHAALAPLIAPGGLLVTASCTARLGADELLLDAVAGLREGGRRVTRELRRSGAGCDHPIPPALPELRYLSCLVLALD